MHMARIRALAIVGTLTIAGAVLVIVTFNRDKQHDGPVAQSCPAGYVMVNATLPKFESEVKINVFNATNTPHLAADVSSDFANRKFVVVKTGDEKQRQPDKVAVLRFGPKAVGASYLLKAYFLNYAVDEFDIKRKDDVVDVVIGGKFKTLATQTEMRQSIAQQGKHEDLKGTCTQ